jgi:hypothetical protein
MEYMKYFSDLGLKLKLRKTPRGNPRSLHFTVQAYSAAGSTLPLNTLVTIKPDADLVRGYIVAEFSGMWGTLNNDLKDGTLFVNLPDLETVGNRDFAEYVSKLKPTTFCVVKIGKTPVTQEKPLHVLLGTRQGIDVVRVTWFDEWE